MVVEGAAPSSLLHPPVFVSPLPVVGTATVTAAVLPVSRVVPEECVSGESPSFPPIMTAPTAVEAAAMLVVVVVVVVVVSATELPGVAGPGGRARK